MSTILLSNAKMFKLNDTVVILTVDGSGLDEAAIGETGIIHSLIGGNYPVVIIKGKRGCFRPTQVKLVAKKLRRKMPEWF